MTSDIHPVWESVRLADILHRVRRPVQVEPDTLYREIGIRSHGKGIFYKEERTGSSLGNKSVFWVEPDCFVVNIVFAWEQAVAKTTHNELGMIASHRFPMYKPLSGKVDLDYLLYFFKSPLGKYLLSLASPGGAGRNKTLGQKGFLDISIPLPSLPEQQKIIDILGMWDKAIALTEQLIAAKKLLQKGLMQNLIFVEADHKCPRMRLKGYDGEWEKRKIGDVFSRIVRKNDVECSNVLTASAQNGLVSQTEYFNKVVAGKMLDGYYLIKKGEFAYNRGRSVGYPYGAIKRLEKYEMGVLSTLYICFELTGKDFAGEFFKYFFESGSLNQGLYSITQEGARNHGLLNLNIADFFGLSIPVPPIPEQTDLATFFELVDRELDLLSQKRAALQQQKKGLMQQLLTGKVRVKTG